MANSQLPVLRAFLTRVSSRKQKKFSIINDPSFIWFLLEVEVRIQTYLPFYRSFPLQ